MARCGSLLALLASALLALGARAAELTQLRSSGEPDRPFELSLGVRWERVDRRATIVREFVQPQGNSVASAIADGAELEYTQVTNRLVPRLAVGLWRDLELHAELPWVLGDEPSWRAAEGASAVAGNGLDASGAACAGPCPMVPVGHTLYGGGAFDDLRVGLAWAPLSEARQPWVPTWVVALDVTAPTAARYDPAQDRLTAARFAAGPSASPGHRAAVGRKLWVYELSSAVSRRLGAVEPYLQLRVRLPQRTARTYSNCEHAAELATQVPGQMAAVAVANCRTASARQTEADPPRVYGVALGTEVTAMEDRVQAQRLAFDLRVGADYTTRARWYNELTPATGKLLATEPFLSGSVQAGAVLHASRRLVLGLRGAAALQLPHLLTGETQAGTFNLVDIPNGPAQNPNFDWRWDPPGRRFRLQQALEWSVTISGEFLL